jgi:hypothetical protein
MPRLDHFIAYTLHRTWLHNSFTFAALYLQRLTARFSSAKGPSGHWPFISAFVLASKIICDDTYPIGIVGQGMFALREISQMERDVFLPGVAAQC